MEDYLEYYQNENLSQEFIDEFLETFWEFATSLNDILLDNNIKGILY